MAEPKSEFRLLKIISCNNCPYAPNGWRDENDKWVSRCEHPTVFTLVQDGIMLRDGVMNTLPEFCPLPLDPEERFKPAKSNFKPTLAYIDKDGLHDLQEGA